MSSLMFEIHLVRNGAGKILVVAFHLHLWEEVCVEHRSLTWPIFHLLKENLHIYVLIHIYIYPHACLIFMYTLCIHNVYNMYTYLCNTYAYTQREY